MVVILCGWCANTLCIASPHLLFENRTDEREVLSNSGIYVLQVRTLP